MQPRHYIAASALLVSLISLIVSLRTAGFSRRVKLAELRASVLAKVSEASLLNSRLRRAHTEFLDLAHRHNDQTFIEFLDMPEIAENEEALVRIYEQSSKVPIGSAVRIYEGTYHDLNSICDRCRTLEERMTTAKGRYLAIRQPKKV